MDDLDNVIGQAQRVLSLRSFPLFAELTPGDLAVLAQHASFRYFPAGAPLLHPGVPVRSLHFVLRGQVEIVRRGKPNQLVGAHGVVGGLAVLADAADGQQAVAREDTITLELSSDDLEDVFEDNFSILLAVLQVVASQQIRARARLGPTGGLQKHSEQRLEPLPRLGLVEKMMHLRQTLDLSDTSIDALADLATDAKSVQFDAGSTIWSQNDVADHTLVVLSGRISATREQASFQVSFGSGVLIGVAEALAQEPRWYDARAETVACALRLETERIFDVMEDHMELATEMLRALARTTRQLQERVSLPDSEQPIA